MINLHFGKSNYLHTAKSLILVSSIHLVLPQKQPSRGFLGEGVLKTEANLQGSTWENTQYEEGFQ